MAKTLPTLETNIEQIGLVHIYRSTRAKHLRIILYPFEPVRLVVPSNVDLDYAFTFLYSQRLWINRHRAKLADYEHKSRTTTIEIPDIDFSFAREKINTLTAELAAKFGFSYRKVTVRKQKTRWGSCNAHNDISLNYKIAALPQELCEYVILHELMHTKIRNHSARFYTALNELVADAHDLRKKLSVYRLRCLSH